MRFLISEFEQIFSETALRKGLRLLRKKKPELVERHGSHFGYEVDGYRLSLEKTSIEIDHCHCECTAAYCEHLAALMFSFLDPSFDRHENKRLKRQKAYSKPGAAFLSAFSAFQKEWKELQLRGADTPSGLNRFVNFLAGQTAAHDFVTDLAAMAALSLPGRMSLAVEGVRDLSNRYLLRHFAGATALKAREEVMYLCLSEMCRTNERLASGQFSAILPVYLIHTSNMFHLEELRVTFDKRQHKKFFSELFDELHVAKTMVYYRRSMLEGHGVKLVKTTQPENYIALARLHFAAQELDKAWALLESLKQVMHESMPLNYFDLLNYLINVSAAVNDVERQLHFTGELVLNSPYLSTDLAAKYMALLPEESREREVKELMATIRDSRSEGAPDKLFVLAMASGITGDFLQFASRHKVKFHMLHDLLSRHGNRHNHEEVKLYFSNLLDSLLQTEFQQLRGQMLDMAAAFLVGLPARFATDAYLEVLDFIRVRPAMRVHEKAWLRFQPRGKKAATLSLRA